MSNFSDSTHCQKCRKDIWEIADAGKYLERTSPKGEKFKGQCAPCCEYHQIDATKDGGTAILNCLDDNTK